MILVHASPCNLIVDHGHPSNLGVLSSPRCVYRDADDLGYRWAADNDAYLAWDEKKYLRMLEVISEIPGCLFVTVPDVVGDAKATLDRFDEWENRVRATGHPVAFVVQNGVDEHPVPWDRVDAVFIGGTDDGHPPFKFGPVAAEVCREARQRGKWLHMGRVNTHNRIRYANSLGCDSVDGTNFSMYRRTKLPKALRWALSEQLWSPA
jgi:hypothetical protein